MFRFITNCKQKDRARNTLSTAELKNLLLFIFKIVQHQAFGSEILKIQLSNTTDSTHCIKKSNLRLLYHFVDEEGLLRVGGRLKNASVPFNQKHPVIIPYKDHVTYLIIQREHENLLHAGLQATLAYLRLKF